MRAAQPDQRGVAERLEQRVVTGHTRSATCDGGQDRHRVTVGDRGVQPAGEPDVLVVDVDVDEAVQLAVVVHEPVGDAGVVGLEVGDDGLQRVAVGVDALLAAGVGAQDGRDETITAHGASACRIPSTS